MQTLAAFLLSMTGSLAARVLFSLGFGIFSYASLSVLASNVITAAQANFNLLDPVILQLLNLGGAGEFLGLLSAAFTTRAALSGIKRLRPV